mmetsp:Transcript_2565/g.5116  ORF Transcript_2565/g.5116 Transcript_2565/m.5116 type:complete len:210 (+) Transcript_2565:647-1276(+)
MSSTSGRINPWSIGTSWRVLASHCAEPSHVPWSPLYVWLRLRLWPFSPFSFTFFSLCLTSRLAPLRSQFSSRISRIAILCTSDIEKRLELKSSAGPMFGTKVWREPILGTTRRSWYMNLEWLHSTMPVTGTPAKPPVSRMKAATSRTHASPGLIPCRKLRLGSPDTSLPLSFGIMVLAHAWPRGLFTEKGSSSCGLKHATCLPRQSGMK